MAIAARKGATPRLPLRRAGLRVAPGSDWVRYWHIDPRLFWLTPAAGVSAPACWIRSAGFLINTGALLANVYCRSAVSRNGCHELEVAVTVPVVETVDELGDPLTGQLFGGKWLAGVIRAILNRSERGFRLRIVV